MPGLTVSAQSMSVLQVPSAGSRIRQRAFLEEFTVIMGKTAIDLGGSQGCERHWWGAGLVSRKEQPSGLGAASEDLS